MSSFVWLWLCLVCSQLKGAGVWKKNDGASLNVDMAPSDYLPVAFVLPLFSSSCTGLIFNCWKFSFTGALQRSFQQWPDSAAARRFRFAVFAHVSVRNLWHSTPSLFSVFFSFPFVFLSASTSPGCHTLSSGCDWSIYTVNFVVSVFHGVFRLVSSFEIRVLCSPFLEWRLQAQPQVAADHFHPLLLLQASEWKWPDRAAGRHLRLVVSTEFPVRACENKKRRALVC